MRKVISTVQATALLLAGLWLCWLFFTGARHHALGFMLLAPVCRT